MLTTVDSLLAALFSTAPLLCAFSFYPLMASAYSWLLLTHGFSLPPLLGVSLGEFPFPNKEDLTGKSVTATSVRHNHQIRSWLSLKGSDRTRWQDGFLSSAVGLDAPPMCLSGI